MTPIVVRRKEMEEEEAYVNGKVKNHRHVSMDRSRLTISTNDFFDQT